MNDFALYHWEGVATSLVIVMGFIVLMKNDRCPMAVGAFLGIVFSSLSKTQFSVRAEYRSEEAAYMAVVLEYFWGAVLRGMFAGGLGAAIMKWYWMRRTAQRNMNP